MRLGIRSKDVWPIEIVPVLEVGYRLKQGGRKRESPVFYVLSIKEHGLCV